MVSAVGGTGLRGDIQGLRAVAVLGVVLFHAERWAPAGFVGVDVFFVISGYVITASILSRRGGDGRSFSIGDFYRRRAKRILPALTFFVLLALPLVLVMGPANAVPDARRTATAAGLFVANVQLLLAPDAGYFDVAAEQNPFLHTWSLSVEEQFYLFYPLLFGGLLLRRFRSLSDDRTVGRILLGLTAVSFVAMLGTISVVGTPAAFYLSPTRAWEFLAGAAVAWYRIPIRGWVASFARLGGLALIVGTMGSFEGVWPGVVTVVPVLGAALVVAASGDEGAGVRLLDNRPMRFIGSVSYSWYLWHWPMAVLARQADPSVTWLDDVAVVAALVPATASLWLVENPIRYAPNVGTSRLVRASVASIAAVVVLGTVIVPALDRALPGSTDDIEAEASGEHVFVPDACRDDPLLDRSLSSPCVIDGGPDAPVVALVGDSEAAQLSIPFADATRSAGWTGFVRVRASCSFLPHLSVESNDGPRQGCNEFNDELWAALVETPPDLIVISNNLDFAMSNAFLSVVDPDGDRATDPEVRRRLVIDELSRIVGGLQSAGSEVVLVRRPPPTRFFNILACPRWRWVLDQASCGKTSTIEAAVAARAHEDRVLDLVAGERGVAVLDYDALLCPDGICRAHDGDGWVYADANHVTAQHSPQLRPLFEPLLPALEPAD
jgi:peptidoglycan/LPS O-acetylase OafA/YrhL